MVDIGDDSNMQIYKNCPSCGGTLDDTGRCKYCNSKVYDFCNIDLTGSKKTYLRLKNQNQIITAQVEASPSITITCEHDQYYPTMEVEFTILEITTESEDEE